MAASQQQNNNMMVQGFIQQEQQKGRHRILQPQPLYGQAPHRRRPATNTKKRSPASTTTSSTTTTATTQTKDKSPPHHAQGGREKRKRKRNTFSQMFVRLKDYYEKHGHSLVSAEDEDTELYKWTRSIRKNYRHQFTQQVRPKKQNKKSRSSITDSNNSSSSTTTTTRRPVLSESKVELLQSVNFCWDVQEAIWRQRYQQLAEFYNHYGRNDPDFPLQAEDPSLAIWLQNQRRDYRLWAQNLPGGNPLSANRLQALEELGVLQDYQTQQEAWSQYYQYLVEYHQEFGHANVPQNYHHPVTINVIVNHNHDGDRQQQEQQQEQQVQQRNTTFALGKWCMNQRTARKRWDSLQEEHQQQQEDSTGSKKKAKKSKTGKNSSTTNDGNDGSSKSLMSLERIQMLDALDFSWNVRDTKWYILLQRLQDYYNLHGHLKIATNDVINQDLRRWLIQQRHYYQRRQEPSLSSPITEVRITAMEDAIPDFEWIGRPRGSGPSTKDWSNLFEAMRQKGIAPNARPKQHWFEGVNPFAMEVKSEWTEQELIDLWHQDGDDDDDDGDDFDETMFANGGGGINYFVDLEDATDPTTTGTIVGSAEVEQTASRQSKASSSSTSP